MALPSDPFHQAWAKQPCEQLPTLTFESFSTFSFSMQRVLRTFNGFFFPMDIPFAFRFCASTLGAFIMLGY